jgi:hypothetical protein
MPDGMENRALEPAKSGEPLAEQVAQQTRHFLGAPVFRFQPHLGLGREINRWQFALHNNLRIEWVMKLNAATGGYLVETTNWWALTGFGECGGGPATSQMAIPVKAAATKVGITIVFCWGIS